MQKLLIYGASGLGREILDMIEEINSITPQYKIEGWIDDGVPSGAVINNVTVLGNINYIATVDSCAVVLAIADPNIKEQLYNKIKAENTQIVFPIIVHPSSSVSPLSELDEGVIITRFCWVTANTRIGKCVLLNTRCDVGHDSRIGNFSSLMPSVNISGNVTTGKKVYIGVQSALLQGLSIGDNAIIGMGSKVMTNVPPNCTVLGNPAKIIQRREKC
ncbi:acetyltransferase [Cloacibacillus sp. An23]|uniref:acetyltransferase n=1 Tax=Cloacibacillus sp. An23 TaxID=1965591 RepID=UPI001302D681|nr:acetyltransferase [Cloacibacillus sp. An23]